MSDKYRRPRPDAAHNGGISMHIIGTQSIYGQRHAKRDLRTLHWEFSDITNSVDQDHPTYDAENIYT